MMSKLMIRTCDGNDPNLTGADGKPCECGLVFDDVRYMVRYPHLYIPTREEKEALLSAWAVMRNSMGKVWKQYKESLTETPDRFPQFIIIDKNSPVPRFNTAEEAQNYFKAWGADPEKAAIYVRYDEDDDL